MQENLKMLIFCRKNNYIYIREMFLLFLFSMRVRLSSSTERCSFQIVSSLPAIVTIDLKVPAHFLPDLDEKNKLAIVFARAIDKCVPFLWLLISDDTF